MIALSPLLRTDEAGRVMFWCPGCDEEHVIRVRGGSGPGWGYNGVPDAPTFTPSVLFRSVRFKGGDEEFDRILDTYKFPEERERMLADKRIAWTCHSFVTDGRIQFLGDCSHALAGQTIPLPPFPEASDA
ncbi:DUF6527 family protein [Devosia ginsengisoli]|uniref:Ammonia monooxygenase n=1 Tax=Devosia ginsengisoli TaxID=400770 RepID=A0A5B8LSN3_9HYPH|nr:DUF6527 family protein [Devosia ginsengisoli]QDZ10502.1 ammonia monooxygenase [Devosia ginsengisoli]